MRRLLFFSAEAHFTKAGGLIVKVANRVEKKFNEMYTKKYENQELESITIVFVCLTQQMMKEGVLKERNYISHKNKYADMRLWIDSDEYIKADEEKRKQMIWNIISRALNNIRLKKAFNRIDEFEEDLKQVYWRE